MCNFWNFGKWPICFEVGSQAECQGPWASCYGHWGGEVFLRQVLLYRYCFQEYMVFQDRFHCNSVSVYVVRLCCLCLSVGSWDTKQTPSTLLWGSLDNCYRGHPHCARYGSLSLNVDRCPTNPWFPYISDKTRPLHKNTYGGLCNLRNPTSHWIKKKKKICQWYHYTFNIKVPPFYIPLYTGIYV